jgi:hypothetical protein
VGKKQFNGDFDKLFGVSEEVQEEKEVVSRNPVKPVEQPAQSSKSFQGDLHAFLQTTFEEAFNEQLAARQQGDIPLSKKGKPMGGLDSLIRSTIDPDSIRFSRNEGGGSIRRISLAFKERQIEKLRKIANLKRAMLKDVIYDVVEEYLKEFEKKQGSL